MGTLCSRHWDLLEEEREKDCNIGRGQSGWSHLCFCSITMDRQVSIKLLCVSTRKSVRAVVHAPAPTVVGMRYSRGVSRVKVGSRCFSSTLRRAVLCACVREGVREGGRERWRDGGRKGGSGCAEPAPAILK